MSEFTYDVVLREAVESLDFQTEDKSKDKAKDKSVAKVIKISHALDAEGQDERVKAKDDMPVKMKDLPAEERPRERMVMYGPSSLSNADLLAIILRTGSQGIPVNALAEKVLADLGGVHELINTSVDELTGIKAIGEAKAVQIMAAIELGRRVVGRQSKADMVRVKKPKDAADYMMDELRFLEQEVFAVLYLNSKHYITGYEKVTIGSLNSSIAHPREVFKSAIRRNSAAIICVHNHPSGDPAPSPEDLSVTKRLVETGKIVGISVLDHIIIGDNRYYSMKENADM